MTRFSATRTLAASVPLLLFLPLAAQSVDQSAPALTAPSAAAPSASKVRIVRLSEVKGGVQMDRANGGGFATAIANLPVVERSRIETGQGAAEVEFEDNSTVRIAPDSLVEFPALERMPGGTTVSSVRLVKGMAYVSLMKTAGNEFNLLFGEQSLRLPPASHIRLQLDEKQARLAVLDGGLHVDTPSGELDVPKKRTVTFALTGSVQPEVSREVASDPFDEWDHDSAAYHARPATMSAFSNSPYTFGLNDMAYYGAFSDLGECGMMWRPYFASAAWDPYANGAWAWYGGAGYSWVSPYPWGWMPYNYGSWSFCPGAGWGWMPGGSWMGLGNAAGFAGLKGPGHRPVSPVHPPVRGQPGLLLVNSNRIVPSSMSPAGSFVFRKDSAGLGIPREGLGKLSRFSERTLDKGFARTTAYVQTLVSPAAAARGGGELAVVTSIHRGSPPSSGEGGSFPGGGSHSIGAASSTVTTTSSSVSASHGSSGGSHH